MTGVEVIRLFSLSEVGLGSLLPALQLYSKVFRSYWGADRKPGVSLTAHPDHRALPFPGWAGGTGTTGQRQGRLYKCIQTYVLL